MTTTCRRGDGDRFVEQQPCGWLGCVGLIVVGCACSCRPATRQGQTRYDSTEESPGKRREQACPPAGPCAKGRGGSRGESARLAVMVRSSSTCSVAELIDLGLDRQSGGLLSETRARAIDRRAE